MASRKSITLGALLGIAAVAITQGLALRFWYPGNGLSGLALFLALVVPAPFHFAFLKGAHINQHPLTLSARVLSSSALALIGAVGTLTWLFNIYGT